MKSFLTRCLLAGLLVCSLGTTTAWSQAQTFVVNTTDDVLDDTDNLLSLREAVLAANANAADGDIIQFDNALDGQTIMLLLGEISIEDDLQIGVDGLQVSVVIDAGGASRIFYVNTQSAAGTRDVDLWDLSFINGMADNGGAFFVEEGEEVRCTRCVFDSNVATGDMPGMGGGAIFNAGSFTLMYTDVTNNTATNGAGNGGGILNAPSGTLTMGAGTFMGNVANRAGGAVENDGGMASFEGMLFSQNIAGPDSLSAVPGNGGAIHVSGMGTTTIRAGVAVGNVAFSEGGAFWNGAGLMTVDGVTIGGRGTGEPNIAQGPAADNGGGGLFNNGGTLEVKRTTLIANMATGMSGSGGGILSDGGSLNISESTLLWNNSIRAGGGIESTNGATLTLVDVDFSQNTTGPAPGNGGALHVTGAGNTMITGGMVTVNSAASEGGGFWNGTGTMTISGTQIGGASAVDANVASGDEANNGGGGLFNNGGTLIADNIRVMWNRANGAAGSGGGVLSDSGSVNITNSLIQGNLSMRAGGGLESTRNAIVTLEDVDFVENETGPAPGNGGAVHVTGAGTTTITGGTATANRAASEGGAFWNGSGVMTIDGTQIGGENLGNSASGDDSDNGGGGVFGINGTLKISNAWIEGNIADGEAGSGGGVLNDGGMLWMDNTIVRGNSASRAGGGVESNGMPDADGAVRATVDSLSFVTLEANRTGVAPGNGGGLHLTGPGRVSFVQSLAVGNEAANEGGGLWNSGAGTMTVLNSTISGNSAPLGGGLFQQAGSMSAFSVWFTTIARNNAESGGGFQSEGVMPVLYNTLFSANTATQTGANCSGGFSSNGFNLIEDITGCGFTPAASDLTGISAMLMDLADNGGPTATHGLMPGSPAIDAGECGAISVDQRDLPRVAPCDIGAFESADAPPAADNGFTFTLINAETNQPISGFDPIPNGVNVIRGNLPQWITVRANVPDNPGSVQFDFNDQVNFRTENVAPYALFGDVQGNYAAQTVENGLQTVTATAYAGPQSQGDVLASASVSFAIVQESNTVTRFVLVDADTDADVLTLSDGAMIMASDLPASVNIRAEAGAAVKSAWLQLGADSRSETVAPFALFGDLSGDYLAGSLSEGMYTLTATPYDKPLQMGNEGNSLTIQFWVTNQPSGSVSEMPAGKVTTWPVNEQMAAGDWDDTQDKLVLQSNYPNPFNPTTEIRFSIASQAQVELIVFNLLGQRVRTLVNGVLPGGSHQVNFDAADLPSGIYLYRLVTPQGTVTRKMTLAK